MESRKNEHRSCDSDTEAVACEQLDKLINSSFPEGVDVFIGLDYQEHQAVAGSMHLGEHRK